MDRLPTEYYSGPFRLMCLDSKPDPTIFTKEPSQRNIRIKGDGVKTLSLETSDFVTENQQIINGIYKWRQYTEFSEFNTY